MPINPIANTNHAQLQQANRGCDDLLFYIAITGLAAGAIGAFIIGGLLFQNYRVLSYCFLTAGTTAALSVPLSIDFRTLKKNTLPEVLKLWVENVPEGKQRNARNLAKERILLCVTNQETSLDLSHLNLDSLPNVFDHLAHVRSLYLNNNFLKTLPETVGNLTHLEVLRLRVNMLETLPETICGLTQLKELDLSLNALESLPEGMGALAHLQILKASSNRLSSLPNSLFTLPQECIINLENNRFSSGAVERIQANTNGGPRLILAIREKKARGERNLDQLLEELSLHASKRKIRLHHLAHNEQLKNWLSRLVDVGDYQNDMRKKIAVMIYEAIEKAETNTSFREVFFSCLESAEETCGDRVALSILYLDLNLQIQKCVEEKDLPTLAHLLWHGTYALSQLAIYAQIKERTLKGVDPIEVYLAYPIKLKELLNIPIVNESMLYFKCSGITEEDLQNTGNEMKELLSNKELFLSFLVKEETWIKALGISSNLREETEKALKL